ncbi:helix-turn-helix domain-containing protein [Streptomyces sp. NPDC051940]|uniref:helix-turn-helix domain-containing protein n=1 Tax=Streptomyces sp. NPDC051940 TaxID=3155675 RepID=UPI00343118DB
MAGLFGLDASAETIYRLMLRHPYMRLPAIATELGLTHEQVRRGLDDLAQMSLVRSSWEEPGALRAVPPQVGLGSLLEAEERDLHARQEQLAARRIALERVVEEYRSESRNRPYDGVEQLAGIDAIRERIETLASSCQSEIQGFAPDGAQTEANREASRPADLATLDRGIRMKTIYLESLMQDSASLAYARWLIEEGAEVRTVATLPIRMIIYDRRYALLPIDPDDTAAGALLLRGAGVVLALCELFDQIWCTAMPIERARTAPPEGLSRQERAVLRLLAQGHTDEVVARKLGVSVRTARRVTAGLLAQFNARSRFQAGVQAALGGWVDADGSALDSPRPVG